MFFFCCCDFWCTRLLLELKGETTLCLRAFHFSVIFCCALCLSCIWVLFGLSISRDSLRLQRISFGILSNSIIPYHFISFQISFPWLWPWLLFVAKKTGWSLLVASQRRLVRSTSPYHNWLWWFNALLVLEVRMTQWWRGIWLIRLVFFYSFWDVLANK